MLTGKLVRVRFARDRVIPRYVDPAEATWQRTAEQLCDLYRHAGRRTRGEIEEETREIVGDDTGQLVGQGLAKLLEDRCEFETVSGQPPEELREAVFVEAARTRRKKNEDGLPHPFDRNAVLTAVAESLNTSAEIIDSGLFADLKSEQRLARFDDISSDRLLQRYNVGLAQAVLLRSTQVQVQIRREPAARFRQLLRRIKFHRLICEIQNKTEETHHFLIDGPMSLFTSTQKYGLQLAMFLPALLHCRDFDLRADLRWGPERKPKQFALGSEDGLVSPEPDIGMRVPLELEMFAELFRKKIGHWEISEEPEIFPIGKHYWVPDFRLTHRDSGRRVLLEVLGFWRRAAAESHVKRLNACIKEPFILAVSESLTVDESELASLPAGIHRFRQIPLPEEIARLAGDLICSEGYEEI